MNVLIHIIYHCRLGGNPCCNFATSKNPTPNEQLNCRDNSSTIQIGEHIHHNNFLAFQRLNIHGQVRDCALFIKKRIHTIKSYKCIKSNIITCHLTYMDIVSTSIILYQRSEHINL